MYEQTPGNSENEGLALALPTVTITPFYITFFLYYIFIFHFFHTEQLHSATGLDSLLWWAL